MTTPQVTIRRSDFGSHADSEGMEYFDYVLSALGVSPKEWGDVEEVELSVADHTLS